MTQILTQHRHLEVKYRRHFPFPTWFEWVVEGRGFLTPCFFVSVLSHTMGVGGGGGVSVPQRVTRLVLTTPRTCFSVTPESSEIPQGTVKVIHQQLEQK